MKKNSLSSVLLVVALAAAYFVFLSFFPINLEINHTDMESFAHIHRKSMIPPFKDIDITVDGNVTVAKEESNVMMVVGIIALVIALLVIAVIVINKSGNKKSKKRK